MKWQGIISSIYNVLNDDFMFIFSHTDYGFDKHYIVVARHALAIFKGLIATKQIKSVNTI